MLKRFLLLLQDILCFFSSCLSTKTTQKMFLFPLKYKKKKIMFVKFYFGKFSHEYLCLVWTWVEFKVHMSKTSCMFVKRGCNRLTLLTQIFSQVKLDYYYRSLWATIKFIVMCLLVYKGRRHFCIIIIT